MRKKIHTKRRSIPLSLKNDALRNALALNTVPSILFLAVKAVYITIRDPKTAAHVGLKV